MLAHSGFKSIIASLMWLSSARAVKAAARSHKWMFTGDAIEVVDMYKYLGLDFTNSPGRGKWNSTLSRMYSKVGSCSNLVMYQGGGCNGLRPRTMVHQWKSLCRPLAEYGCELWEGEISATWSDKVESLHSRFGRAAVGTKTKPTSVALVLTWAWNL